MNIKILQLLLFLLPLVCGADMVVESGANIVNSATIVLEDGNLQNSGSYTGDGTTKITGSTKSTIGGTGTTQLGNVQIEKDAPTTAVSATGTITVTGEVSTKSNLDLNGKTVSLGTTGTLNETTGSVLGDSGTITATRTLTTPTTENVAGLGATISSTADMGVTTVTRGHTAQTDINGESAKRYYLIEPTNNSGLDATLAFNYADEEVTGSESQLRLFGSTGGSSWWGTASSVDVDGNSITVSGIDSFAKFTVGFNAVPVLTSVNSAVIPKDGSLTITKNHYVASDLDDNTLTLTPKSGENYTVAGTVITPTAGFVGTIDVPFCVSDSWDSSNVITQSFTVRDEAANRAPVIDSIADIAIEKNHSGVITSEMIYSHDADDDAVTIIIGDGNNYTLDGLTIIPSKDYVGRLSVPISATDGIDTSAITIADVSVFENIIDYHKGQILQSETFNVVIAPNPAPASVSEIKVRAEIGTSDQLSVKIFDAVGNLVSEGDAAVDGSVYEYSWDFRNRNIRGNSYIAFLTFKQDGAVVNQTKQMIGIQK